MLDYLNALVLGLGEFAFDVRDFDNTWKWHGLRLSCPRLAKFVNEILEQQGCCQRVRCRAGEARSPLDVLPPVALDPVFMRE